MKPNTSAIAAAAAIAMTALLAPPQCAEASERSLQRLEEASRQALMLAGLVEAERSRFQAALAHGEAAYVTCRAEVHQGLTKLAREGLTALTHALVAARTGRTADMDKQARRAIEATLRGRSLIALGQSCKPLRRKRCAGTSGCTVVAVAQRGAPLIERSSSRVPWRRASYMPHGTRWDVMAPAARAN